jgi:hypothetical protein
MGRIERPAAGGGEVAAIDMVEHDEDIFGWSSPSSVCQAYKRLVGGGGRDCYELLECVSASRIGWLVPAMIACITSASESMEMQLAVFVPVRVVQFAQGGGEVLGDLLLVVAGDLSTAGRQPRGRPATSAARRIGTGLCIESR